MKLKRILMALGLMALMAPMASPCSRVVFIGDSIKDKPGLVIVGRTLDWSTPIPTDLYIYPRGMARQSMDKGPMIKWVSKYGSVMAVSYGGGVTEGMNDQGMVMNGLFCKISQYPTQAPGGKKPVMSLSVLVSFFLDNFANVQEVSDWLANNEFVISGQTFDGGTVSLLHWELTDRTGNSLIMEFVDGKINTYMGRDLTVMTNDPFYPEMKAIDSYWEKVGGTHFLPGGVRSQDRFARAAFFINQVPKNTDLNTSFAALASIMGTVSVPYGYLVQGEKNINSTQWRSVADLKNNRYHFKFAYTPGDFYVDLNELMLNPGAPCLILSTKSPDNFFGNVNNKLKKTEPFKPMY